MPIQVKCSRCGTVLAEFNDLPVEGIKNRGRVKENRMSPAELVIQRNGGKCPSCGKLLESDVNKQQVMVSAFNPVEAIP